MKIAPLKSFNVAFSSESSRNVDSSALVKLRFATVQNISFQLYKIHAIFNFKKCTISLCAHSASTACHVERIPCVFSHLEYTTIEGSF